VLLASLDVHRPAAQLQLQQLADRAEVACLPIVAGQSPLEIAARAMDMGRRELFDVVILDTAGRLSIDEALMAEVAAVKAAARPHETLLVVDAMTGQDAVNTARAFQERVGVTGIVMTRVDGDARGGAALSMRSVTGAPIKLLGAGEKLDALEDFHPDRIAGRILGMGDIVSLVERAAETIDRDEAEKLAAKMQKGQFDLEDYASQLKQIGKMGSLSGILGMLPGVGKMKAADRGREPRQHHPQAPRRHHRLHDAQGAPDARHHQGVAQAPHRRRRRHHRAGGEPAAEAVRRHVRDDEADEQDGPEGADARRARGADAEGDAGPRRRPAPVLNRHARTKEQPENPWASRSASPAPAPRSAPTTTSWWPTAARRATAASSRRSAPTTRCCPPSTRTACGCRTSASSSGSARARCRPTAWRSSSARPDHPDARLPGAADPVAAEEEGAGARRRPGRRLTSMSGGMILLGEIGRPHGVRGLVRVRSFTAEPMGLTAYGPLTDEAGQRRFVLELLAEDLARIEGVSDRDAAARLTGTKLYVPRDALPPPEEDEFYLADLEGMQAVTEAGEPLGEVSAVEVHGPASFLVLGRPAGAADPVHQGRRAGGGRWRRAACRRSSRPKSRLQP
jgi:16S rRNA processing protein RimM